MTRKKQIGLGKGLESLIPKVYDENFDSNNSISLEDMLEGDKPVKINEPDEKEKADDDKVKDDELVVDDSQEEKVDDDKVKDDELVVDDSQEEITDDDKVKDDELVVDDSQEEITDEDADDKSDDEDKVEEIKLTKKELDHIDEVKEVVAKNPRITLWSAKSAAVFRYLRKTEPEFSISKEASLMIEEAVSEKYPEIWKLFEDV